jgi:hypothetical protein
VQPPDAFSAWQDLNEYWRTCHYRGSTEQRMIPASKSITVFAAVKSVVSEVAPADSWGETEYFERKLALETD